VRRGARRAASSASLCVAVLFLTSIPSVRGPLGAPGPEPSPPAASSDELILSRNLRIRVKSRREIDLVVRPAPLQDWAGLAREYAAEPAAAAPELARLAGYEAPEPRRDVTIPFDLLNDDYRALVLVNLFPGDGPDQGGWLHVARAGRLATPDEGLWQIAKWFAGDGERFREIARANSLSSPDLAQGQKILVPAALLHRSLKPLPTSDDGSLSFGEDGLGSYAGYRLRTGEALYSAVVVRFTGRTDPDDVNAVAADLARRSGIRDVTDIPVGFKVKLPFDLLEPEFLPRGHPRRREADAARKEMAKELARRPVRSAGRGLEGVLVVIDPGHGGRDAGTTQFGVSEHDYAYDVACRLKAAIERDTAARVFMTLEDPGVGFRPSDGDRLDVNRKGTLRTNPPFSARDEGESSVAVNLRWYLANSVLRKAVAEGTAPDRVVFLSLHADSRHPSLRGLMVYVPGQQFRKGTHSESGEEYLRFREVREAPAVRFPRRDLVRSEAVSRRLAADLVEAFRREDLPVQPYQPVRDRVIRGRRTWLPAVLRGNAIPAKVLVEMVNLSNSQDAGLLGSARDRDRLARAMARALAAYFGDAQSGSTRAAGSSP
jgi:N-acetylmuramoyl-L-alanine amidase